jgi:hypothetical protein
MTSLEKNLYSSSFDELKKSLYFCDENHRKKSRWITRILLNIVIFIKYGSLELAVARTILYGIFGLLPNASSFISGCYTFVVYLFKALNFWLSSMQSNTQVTAVATGIAGAVAHTMYSLTQAEMAKFKHTRVGTYAFLKAFLYDLPFKVYYGIRFLYKALSFVTRYIEWGVCGLITSVLRIRKSLKYSSSSESEFFKNTNEITKIIEQKMSNVELENPVPATVKTPEIKRIEDQTKKEATKIVNSLTTSHQRRNLLHLPNLSPRQLPRMSPRRLVLPRQSPTKYHFPARLRNSPLRRSKRIIQKQNSILRISKRK